LTAHTLEKMVVTIQEKKELGPLSPSIEASLPPLQDSEQDASPIKSASVSERQLHESTDSASTATSANTASTTRQSEHRDSDTSISSSERALVRSTSVVKGFTPLAASYGRSTARLAHPTPSAAIPTKANNPIPSKVGFMLGGSSEDECSSFEQHMPPLKPSQQRSSLSQSLSRQHMTNGLRKKVTSFRDVVEARRAEESSQDDEAAIESSDEEDEEDMITDSAIEDDDDEGEWEDSDSVDGRQAVDDRLFKRVDSRAQLTSRRSMLTTAITEEGKQAGLIAEASKSTPNFRRSRATSAMPESPQAHDEGLTMRPPGTKQQPIPIASSSNSNQMAHSPRTTRRNMLSTELTESLRRNLLTERQQQKAAISAVMKRQKARSMANLQEAVTQPNKDSSSWNHYFDNPWEYHAKGW